MIGMQILETVTKTCLGDIEAFLLLFFVIGALISTTVFFGGIFLDNFKMLIIGFICFGCCVLGVIITSATSPKETRYKAVVTDEYAASVQFNEDFEIIEKDGMIYWLRERKNDE